MENKHGSGARAGSLGEKGFYIVLFLCAAVIGVSAWMLLADAGTNVENDTAENPADVPVVVSTMLPAMEPVTPPEDVTAAMAETEPEAEQSPEPQPETLEDTAAQSEQQAQEVFAEGTVSYVWPVQGTVERPYSVDKLLYDSTMADWRTHDGIDIASARATP